MTTKQKFLHTTQVDLVLLEPDDAPHIASWFNNPEVTQYLERGALPMTITYEREFLEKLYKNNEHFMLGIYHRDDQKLIGVCGLHQLSELNKTATYGVCIGEKAYWAKGIGTEVLSAMLEYAFNRRDLRNVTLRVLGNNPRGKRCYEKCGFKVVGTYLQHIFKDGTWHDEHIMVAYSPRVTTR